MKVRYCKQASGGAVPPLRNQETPDGPKSDRGRGWGCLLLWRQRAEGAGFLGWAPCHPPADSKKQSWHLGAVSLFCSVARESFSSFVFPSEAVVCKTNDDKWEVWSQMKTTAIGLCCPDENPAGQPTAKRLCIPYCGKWVSDTNSLLAYKTVYLT